MESDGEEEENYDAEYIMNEETQEYENASENNDDVSMHSNDNNNIFPPNSDEEINVQDVDKDEIPPPKKAKVFCISYCTICEKTFQSKQTFRKHIKSHASDTKANPQPTIQKIESAESSPNEPTPKRPKKVDHKTSHCEQCNKTFSTRTNLLRHLSTHNGNKPFECKICGSGFTQNGSLKSHMLIHTGERPFQCTFCNRGFTQAKSLTFHLRRHTGEKPFSCTMCDLSFRQKDGLKRHIEFKHTDGHIHTCFQCDAQFETRFLLLSHENRMHNSKRQKEITVEMQANEKEYKFVCTECYRPFASDAALQNHHLRKHLGRNKGVGKPPYKCDLCMNVLFDSKKEFVEHTRAHIAAASSAQVSMACELCDTVFDDKAQLRQHRMQHNGQFDCTNCGKNFSEK